ncbi:MAG: ECF transporter S component [Candidatus Cloacimonadota bacterium]|nr:ECF transporter S component [Candidatus Cloacimonadota bacterium]
MNFLKKFSTLDLLYISILSALGLAIKPIVTPLVHLISAPLVIPGGSLAGGFYMMWLVLVMAIVNKPGAGILFCIVQAILVICLGFFGNHGTVSLISYTLPGIVADIVAIFFSNKNKLAFHTTICTVANLAGTFTVTVLVMRLAWIPLLIAMVVSAISGILGGIVSYKLFHKMIAFKIIQIRNCK